MTWEDQTSEHELDALMAEAMMGVEAESFGRSPIGKLVLGRASAEIINLRTELEDTAPENVAEVNRIRLEIKARRLLIQYFTDSIRNGRASEVNLREAENVYDDQ